MKVVAAAPERSAGVEDEAAIAVAPQLEDAPPPVDEAAESAFLAEARERGEVVSARTPAEAEETNGQPLPALDALVNRIPGEVRDVLEELFRAKFVSVKRFPKKVLKQP